MPAAPIGYTTTAGDYCLACAPDLHHSAAKVPIHYGESTEPCRSCGKRLQVG